MRTCGVAALLALVLTAPLYAQQPTPKPTAPSQSSAAPQPQLKDLLESKVLAEWDAFKNKDKKAYGELLTDDYVAVEADGEGERNKWHMLREIEHTMFTEYTLSFLKVIQLGPDAAFVRYEAFFRFPPKSAVPFEKVIIGEIWVKRDGQWKSLHYQETRVK